MGLIPDSGATAGAVPVSDDARVAGPRSAGKGVVVTTPYREGSILSVARAAADEGDLQRFYTSLNLPVWRARAKRIPLLGARLGRELGRRVFEGIPADRIRTAGDLEELAHVAARRVLGPRCRSVCVKLMYRVKRRFDAIVARSLAREDFDVVVGMFGASEASFRVAGRRGALSVLNFVNSHPFEHNRYLSELAGIGRRHHELVPDWVSARVDAELDVADLVLVPSRFVALQLARHGVASEKVVTIPYGVDPDLFSPRTGRGRAGGGPLECLCVGHISHRKGIGVLSEAARYCRRLPVRFRLIGPIVSREVLDDLPDNVEYAGAVQPAGVAAAMRKADLFALPSLEDAFALVVLEAMAAGLPVIVTSHTGASELIEDGKEGLIIPAADARALADAVERLVLADDWRRGMGDAARRTVEGGLSWGRYGRQVLAAISTRRAACG